MTLAQVRAALAALRRLRDNGNHETWLLARIEEYEQELTTLWLLDGKPKPFVPYRNADGLLVINEFGDTENDF